MVENKDQEKIQEKYMKFQSLQEQIKQINEHLEKVDERIGELTGIINNVDEISKIKEGNEILVPISNGIFIKANAQNSEKFLVNTGAKTVVEKDKEGVRGLLEKQKIELIHMQHQMMEDLNESETEAVKLQEELQALIG